MTCRLPGLIDVHVHFRYPGQTHKEDFDTGTRAALKDGFTRVLDMPNNVRPTVSLDRIAEKAGHAAAAARCDIGFHYGTDGHNGPSRVSRRPFYVDSVACNLTLSVGRRRSRGPRRHAVGSLARPAKAHRRSRRHRQDR